MNVLLAGATGETGIELIRALSQAGHRPCALVRPQSRAKLDQYRGQLSGLHEGDVRVPDSLHGCCRGIDVVISTITRTSSRERHVQVDYEGNLALLAEAERAGARRFVFVSSVGAGSTPGVPVLEQKGRFEEALKQSRLSWLIVRPSALFQDMERIFSMARAGTLILFGNGMQRVSPLAEADLARLIVSRLDGPSEAIEAGGPETLTMDEVGRMAQRVTGRPESVRHLPVWVLGVVVSVVRVIRPDAWPVMRFVQHVFSSDNAAPAEGSALLDAYFRQLAAGPGAGDMARLLKR